jgi:hypothetical protein
VAARAKPFDLWPLVPPSLRAVMPSESWNRTRLQELVLPTDEVPVAELRWQLDLPWWRGDASYFSVSPNQVRQEPERFRRQWRRTLAADLTFPVHLLEGRRLIVLDGLHRLLKADVSGLHLISAHVLSRELFAEQIVERDT